MTAAGQPFEFRTEDGLTLRGVRWGEGPGTMVFSPGNGFTAQTYLPALEPLLPRVRIHGFNPRGFGGSDIPAEFDTWEAPVADLRRYVEQEAGAPVVLGGHSYGSLLSLRLAAEAPELVRGLLLVDPVLPYRRDEPWPPGRTDRQEELITRTRTRRGEWPHRESAEKWLRARGGYGEWHQAPMDAFLSSGVVERKGGGVRLACPPWLETRIYETSPGPLVWEWAARARAPIVILRGEDSLVGNPQALEDLAEMMPVGTVLTVKGTHTLAQEEPERTGQALAAAWDILERTSPDGETAL